MRWIVIVLFICNAIILWLFVMSNKFLFQREKMRLHEKKRADKNAMLIHLFYMWVRLCQMNGSIIEYFRKNEITSIAVYGTGKLGDLLKHELKNSKCSLKFFIDNNCKIEFGGVPCYTIDAVWPKVDVIVITPIYDYRDIEINICKNRKISTIGIDKILIDCLENTTNVEL